MKKAISMTMALMLLVSAFCITSLADNENGPSTRGIEDDYYIMTIDGALKSVKANVIVGFGSKVGWDFHSRATDNGVIVGRLALRNVHYHYSVNCDIPVSGAYNNEMDQAIRNFQDWGKLTQDGQIGPTTWGKFVTYCK